MCPVRYDHLFKPAFPYHYDHFMYFIYVWISQLASYILMLMYNISDEYIVNKFTDHLLVNVNLVAS